MQKFCNRVGTLARMLDHLSLLESASNEPLFIIRNHALLYVRIYITHSVSINLIGKQLI